MVPRIMWFLTGEESTVTITTTARENLLHFIYAKEDGIQVVSFPQNFLYLEYNWPVSKRTAATEAL